MKEKILVHVNTTALLAIRLFSRKEFWSFYLNYMVLLGSYTFKVL
jgi:hypothetical protein